MRVLGGWEHRYQVFAVTAIGIFATVFDTSASIVALPTIAHELGTTLPTAQWVIIGNTLTISALLVPMGRWSDIVGRKRIYVVGCCLFALGALFATATRSIHWLIAARAIVGIGSAMTQSTAMAILIGNFGMQDRARMLGLQTGGVGLGAIAGPAMGGVIVGTVGWRALFLVTAVCMAVLAVAAQHVLKRRTRRPAPTDPPFDLLGALLFSVLLVAGLLTLTLGPGSGWSAPTTLGGLVISTLALAAFIAVEKRHPSPMLDFGMFRATAFSLGSLGAVVVFMGISAMRFLAPFFFQGVRGFSPAGVGLLLMPGAAVTALVAPFVGRIADRYGVRLFANVGFFVALAGLVTFTRIDVGTPTWLVVTGLMILALGMAAFSAPNSTSILNSVPADAHGVAAGFVNLCRNTGNVMGIAYGTAVVTLAMGSAGFAPSLSAVGPGSSREVFAAFTHGVQLTSISLVLLAVPVLGLLLLFARGTRTARR